jgi:hypothetical protein
MAREAELHCHVKLTEHGLIIEDLQYFANLVAAAEREACAKACEDEIKRVKPIYSVTAENALKAIRARGEK